MLVDFALIWSIARWLTDDQQYLLAPCQIKFGILVHFKYLVQNAILSSFGSSNKIENKLVLFCGIKMLTSRLFMLITRNRTFFNLSVQYVAENILEVLFFSARIRFSLPRTCSTSQSGREIILNFLYFSSWNFKIINYSVVCMWSNTHTHMWSHITHVCGCVCDTCDLIHYNVNNRICPVMSCNHVQLCTRINA